MPQNFSPCKDVALSEDQVLDGVLVRIAARDRNWPALLPATPKNVHLTVTLGHPNLCPIDDEAFERGYRIVGVASGHRPIGACVDVWLPQFVLTRHAEWASPFRTLAERVFDLRLGPVRFALEHELALHAKAADSAVSAP
jgi:hypothetical protein